MKTEQSILTFITCLLIVLGSIIFTLSFMAFAFIDLSKANNEEICTGVWQQIALTSAAILYALISIASMIAGYMVVKMVKGIEQFYIDWIKK